VSAPVLAFEAHVENAPTPNDRGGMLSREARAAEEAVHAWLQECGLLPADHRHGFGFGVPDQLAGLEKLRALEARAHFRQVMYWRNRTDRLEAVLRRALASDALDDDSRRAIIDGLHGPGQGRRRDLKALSEVERRIVDHYRQVPAVDKRTVRTLLQRLAWMAASGEGGRR
jgi:hypothetical protein